MKRILCFLALSVALTFGAKAQPSQTQFNADMDDLIRQTDYLNTKPSDSVDVSLALAKQAYDFYATYILNSPVELETYFSDYCTARNADPLCIINFTSCVVEYVNNLAYDYQHFCCSILAQLIGWEAHAFNNCLGSCHMTVLAIVNKHTKEKSNALVIFSK